MQHRSAKRYGRSNPPHAQQDAVCADPVSNVASSFLSTMHATHSTAAPYLRLRTPLPLNNRSSHRLAPPLSPSKQGAFQRRRRRWYLPPGLRSRRRLRHRAEAPSSAMHEGRRSCRASQQQQRRGCCGWSLHDDSSS